MAQAGGRSFSLVYTGLVLAIVLLPDFLGAIPVRQHENEEVSSEVKSQAMANLKKLVRNRRSLPQFKRLPDFWGWYKYFMETGNQEGVEDLDRMYMSFLQKEGTPNHYLTHLSAIYKTCADSDDPECIAESSSKPSAKLVMPAPIKAAEVRVCNPYYDPLCLFALVPKPAAPAPAPEPAPAPPKLPAPILTPLLPMAMKTPTGFYYYAPVLEPFLSAEQKTELLRICNPSDVECLQYHLRAAYGYRPAAYPALAAAAPGPAPSYSALGCDPTKDPYCKPLLVKKTPTGFYHLYPACDPEKDPLCVVSVVAPPAPAPQAASAEQPPKEQSCNPLFDEGCNPLTATKLAGLTKPVMEHPPKAEPAPPAPALAPCDPRFDPYCLIRAAAALRMSPHLLPPQLLPQYEMRSRLGVKGKTKDGHECFMYYDKDCTPEVASDDAEANFAPVEADAAPAAADEPAQPEAAAVPHPFAGYAAPEYHAPRFEDFLRGYMGQYKK